MFITATEVGTHPLTAALHMPEINVDFVRESEWGTKLNKTDLLL
jgi:hypothetical protein